MKQNNFDIFLDGDQRSCGDGGHWWYLIAVFYHSVGTGNTIYD